MPGTIHIAPDAEPSRLRVTRYSADALEEAEIATLDEVGETSAPGTVTWINVDGLGDEQTLRALGERFNIHRLALEDVVNTHQRAKIEPYDEHLFVVVRMIRADSPQGEQVSLFVGRDYVLTFQEHEGDCFDAVRERLRHGRGLIRKRGADYLAYALIDAVIDAYFPVIEQHGDALEEIEQEVMESTSPAIVRSIHDIKRSLLVMRKAVWPLREAISSLSRDEQPLISEETRVYLRDAYDHVIQVIDMVETQRELAGGQMDLYLSMLGQRTNDIMKVLTIFAAIFIPLSFIAGLYGMNFDQAHPANMPEVKWKYGYPAVLALMATVTGGLLFYFWRKGWIGRRGHAEALSTDDHNA